VGLAATAGAYLWWKGTTPQPPSVDLAGADPAVAKLVQEALDKARHSPWSAKAWGHLGMVLRAHDFGAEANICFAHAQRLDPEDPRWPYLRSLTLLLNDPEKGLELLEQAVEQCKEELAPRLRLAEELLSRGQLDEAERHFGRVLEQEPDHPRALLGMGRLAHQRGDLPAAQKFLERSAQIAPRVRSTHALLAEVHYRQGNRQAADRERDRMDGLPDVFPWKDPYVEQVQQLAVGVRARIVEAEQLFVQGQPQQAIALLERTQSAYEDSHEVLLALSYILSKLGDLAGAEKAQRKATELAPNNVEAVFGLSVLLHKQKRYAEAAQNYRRVLKLNPGHALSHFNLGLCLKEQGDQAAAITALGEAVRHRPDYAPAHKALGLFLKEEGRKGEARIHLKHAVRLAPWDKAAKKWLEQLE
jgi:tetratricopeptide (TPR) repeat protein